MKISSFLALKKIDFVSSRFNSEETQVQVPESPQQEELVPIVQRKAFRVPVALRKFSWVHLAGPLQDSQCLKVPGIIPETGSEVKV